MPVTVERLPNEPIIMARLWGEIDISCISEMYERSVPIIEEVGGTTWRVTDALDVETTFSDVVQILGKIASDTPGATTDPRVKSVLVGTNQWVTFVADSLQQRQYGTLNIPRYETVDEALAFVRSQIAETAAGG